jgi:hypothetical protein
VSRLIARAEETINKACQVRVLSRYFRGHFVRSLRARYQHGELSRIEDPKPVDTLLDALMAQEWVVYSKPCLAHTEAVVAYLARYTQRIALSESRLLDFRDGEVALDYRDYRDAGRHKVMHLSAVELIRRFLLHVLPKGFMPSKGLCGVWETGAASACEFGPCWLRIINSVEETR